MKRWVDEAMAGSLIQIQHVIAKSDANMAGPVDSGHTEWKVGQRESRAIDSVQPTVTHPEFREGSVAGTCGRYPTALRAQGTDR
ncbi:MAG: hypothetical protein ACJ73L_09790 [Actinomycetes bacterium]